LNEALRNYFRNILIKHNNLKIADFGISKFLISTFTKSKSGSPAYQSPEIKLNKGHDFKSDVW
jgi:serine/threonine protein kinase